jgi:hypothetical protein
LFPHEPASWQQACWNTLQVSMQFVTLHPIGVQHTLPTHSPPEP